MNPVLNTQSAIFVPFFCIKICTVRFISAGTPPQKSITVSVVHLAETSPHRSCLIDAETQDSQRDGQPIYVPQRRWAQEKNDDAFKEFIFAELHPLLGYLIEIKRSERALANMLGHFLEGLKTG